ncbi:MAG: dynamin family protein [Gammaproteobacteria bacterium]|nr:dynamin family protein [Gammaproteobacteria bacterium]
MFDNAIQLKKHLKKLEEHLDRENPMLLEIVRSFRKLDKVAYRLGLLPRHESIATRVPWWPMISVLGTFSSGKSTFINYYLGLKLQDTGNQAVDDKFTVICFSSEQTNRTLPGRALDADPRFPFYQMSRDIDEVAQGEGSRVDAYLQLKTCPSDRLRGKILIDSPGFDADEQRTSTLRITDHIIDLSDLVLVFFDARHPEPGAMQDTLVHLVTETIHRPDSTKFLYVLNQIDNAAREDNPEEVFAAWQRALAQKGLTAGRFYSIYDPEAAITIDDAALRERFEAKRAEDIAAINERLNQVEVERAYRIIGVLEQTAKTIQSQIVPKLIEAKALWRRRTAWMEGVVFGLLFAGLAYVSIRAGYWDGFRFAPPWLDVLRGNVYLQGGVAGAVVLVIAYIHFSLRKLAAKSVARGLEKDQSLGQRQEWLLRAFQKNVRPWHFLFSKQPVGWGRFNRKRLANVLSDANRFIQTLNSRFADPSGASKPKGAVKPASPGEGRSADARILKPVDSEEEITVRRSDLEDDEHVAMGGLPPDYAIPKATAGKPR